MFGDLNAEKIRKERQLTKKYELENAITEGAFVNRVELMKGFAMVADAMVSRIMAAELPRPAKEDLLEQLSSVPLVLQETADKQSRLRRGGNGQTDGSED